MADKATLIVEAETDALVTAKNRLDGLNKPAKNAESAIRRMTGSFRVQKNAVQQASFQIQDFAVQVAAGTSAVTAFGQQAPQLLGVLGTGGALLGGVVAVAAAIGGPFLISMFDSVDAAELLGEALDDLGDIVVTTDGDVNALSKELERLAESSQAAARAEISSSLFRAKEAIDGARESIRGLIKDAQPFFTNADVTDFTEEYGNFGRAVEDAKNGLSLTQGEAERLVLTLREFGRTGDTVGLTRSVDELFNSIENKSGALVDFRDDLFEVGENSRKSQEKIDFLTESLKDLDGALANNSVTAIKAAEERAKAEDQAAKARERELEQVRNQEIRLEQLFAREAEKKRKARERELAEEERQMLRIQDQEIRMTEFFAREAEKRRRIEEQTARITMAQDQMVLTAKMDFVGQVGAALQQGAEEGSVAAKIGYATVQAVQVAQAINSANVAAAGQLAAYAGIPDPSGALLAAAQARAETIRGVGYATAGLIAGQTIGNIVGGRAQGGQVRPGETYRVGEYGPETITMGSNGGFVTPNGASNDSQINLVTNVKVIGGSGNSTVTNEVSQVGDSKWVQDIIVTEMGNPTSKSRQALQSSSNVMATGTR